MRVIHTHIQQSPSSHSLFYPCPFLPSLRMRIAFVDPLPWDYQVETPYQQALGGSQSAVCYLAEALAHQGHEVFLLNGTSFISLSRGVVCLPLSLASRGLFQSLGLKALIVVNQPDVGLQLKPLLTGETRLICWIQSAPDQSNMRSLSQPQLRQAYDGFALVSDWQRERFQPFGLADATIKVLRNAIAPAFQSLFSDADSILAAKTQPPILAYTSTPFRGLEWLLELFPQIRAAVPSARLKVFSSMQVYQQDASHDEFRGLYDRCRAVDGVEYIGSLSQPQLAQELRSVTMLTYPNIFFETSCIAALEAIASGCQVITSAIGALPETTAGFARLIPIPHAESELPHFATLTAQTRQTYAQQFVAAAVQGLQAHMTNPEAIASRNSEALASALYNQVEFANRHCTWSVRSQEWISWLNELPSRQEAVRLQPRAALATESLAPTTHPPVEQPPISPSAPSPDALLEQAAQLGQTGQLDAVKRICQQVLQQYPQSARAFHLMGLALLQGGKTEEALPYLERAIALDPKAADYHGHLGVAYCSAKRVDEGIAACQHALSLQPQWLDVRYNLALALHKRGDLTEAIAHYQQVVECQPQNAQALLNLGNALQQTQRYDQAIARYQQALAIRPNQAETWLRLGTAHQMQENWVEAIRCHQQALTLKPNSPETHNNLGIVMHELGRAREAIAHFQQALILEPNFTHARLNLANTLLKLEQFAEAEAAYRQLLEVDPENLQALDGLVRLLRQSGRWADVDAVSDRLIMLSQAYLKVGKSCLVMPLNTLLLPFSAAEQQAIARQYATAITQTTAELRQQLDFGSRRAPVTKPHKRLRIGYVSGDFRDHAVAHLMRRLFGLHDRDRVEVFAYSLGPKDDSDYRKTFEQECNRFWDVSQWSLTATAQQVFQDEIDILVDLAGYTEYSCPRLFALRPAPIQVNYLGYPGTMGADFIDYILTDRVLTPPELAPYMSEHCVYLPHCYQINDNQQAIATMPPRTTVGVPESGIVYCCFNNTRKIDPHLFAVWMRILQQVPGSVLWLFQSYPEAEQHLKQAAEAHGVQGDRLIFAQRLPKTEHLTRLQHADLFLDTRFYNAHTTASDALWAGVPVLTLVGDTFAARVAASLLTALGLPELITPTLADYEQLAIALGSNFQALHTLKTKLATQRLTMPLYDTERSVRAIERAYEMMWQVYVNGEKPRSLVVSGDYG